MTSPIKHVSTKFGDIAYVDSGSGPPTLFVHGVFLNNYLWRHVIDRVADMRRCIALDLMAHGATRIVPAGTHWPMPSTSRRRCDSVSITSKTFSPKTRTSFLA
jgi:pimeloyl-ACP methyl ester carboxylesterase